MSRLFRVIALTMAVACLNCHVMAANKVKPSPHSTDAVQMVLESEVDSSKPFVDRRTTLKPETRPVSDPDPIWWQAGYIRSGKLWRPYETSLPEGEQAKSLDEYRNLRLELANQPHGDWKLANWCRKNGLLDQERVHLMQVLREGDPSVNRDALYERLGCQKSGGVWVSPKERQDAARFKDEMAISQKRWGVKLETIVQRLEGTARQRVQAEKQLKEIDHPSAVPVILSSLCVVNPFLADYGIQTLAQIPEFEASRALAGQAVFSPWRQVRTKAIENLKQRKLEEFVPDLLLVLTKPIRTSSQPTFQTAVMPGNKKSMNWDYFWIDESQETIRVGVRRLFPISVPADLVKIQSMARPEIASNYDAKTGQRLNSKSDWLALFEMLEQSEMLDRDADLINDFRNATNERVGMVLSKCTDEPPSSDPVHWWTWWANYSSVGLIQQKNVVIVDERQSQPNVPSLSVVTRQLSCLVAGTPIWTELGFVPIETIQPGDRVLAKNVETGELVYKPVMIPNDWKKFTIWS